MKKASVVCIVKYEKDKKKSSIKVIASPSKTKK